MRPGTDDAFALVLPDTDAASMQVFLDHFAHGLAPGVHAAVLMDQAGWHTAHAITLPPNVSLIHLPPYSPELNPVERVWLYLRERFLSHRLFDDSMPSWTAAATPGDGCSRSQGASPL